MEATRSEMDRLLDLLEMHQRATPPPASPTDRDQWCAEIRGLMTRIKNWLDEAQARRLAERPSGSQESAGILLQVEPLQVALAVGAEVYHADALRVIAPGGRFVEIVPKAKAVLGASGRVDIVSPKGRAMIARFGPDQWSFVWPDEKGEWQSRGLTSAALAEVLREMFA